MLRLNEQYESGALSFGDYVEGVLLTGEAPIISNKITRELFELGNNGTSSLKQDLESAAVEKVRSLINQLYPAYEVLRTNSNSPLDEFWRADLVVFPPGRAGIPIQVKSSKTALNLFRKSMAQKGGLLEVNLRRVLLKDVSVYTKAPVATRPPEANDPVSLRDRAKQVKADIDRALGVIKLVAA